MTPQERLLVVAKHCWAYFDNYTRGSGLNGMYDEIVIGRELTAAIAAVEADRQTAQETGLVDVFDPRWVAPSGAE